MKKTIFNYGALAILLSATISNNVNAQTWSLTGNAGTNTATNFIGTTDNKALKFRTFNSVRMTLSSNGKLGIGNGAPAARLDVLGLATDSVSVVKILGKYSGKKQNTIGLESASTPNDTSGIGVSGNGNLAGVEGFGNNIGVSGYGSTAVYGNSDFSTFPTGVWGETLGGTQGNGVFGLSKGATQNIAIWGAATDTTVNDFAGYFQGDVLSWRYFIASDARLKNNIQPINSALDKINKLKTATYTFKRESFPGLYLPTGNQIGFIADNMKQIFPDLVKSVSLPEKIHPKTKAVICQKADIDVVNYMGMIPVLTAGIQEQQVQIEKKDVLITELSNKLTALESRLAALEATSAVQNNRTSSSLNETAAKLEQNNPNPFTLSTQIRYALPEEFKSAQIIITSSNGNVLKNYSIKSKGQGQLTVNANELAAGIYTYSLLIDGRMVDTKSLVLTK